MTASWQKVLSTLAAERLRELYAQSVLGQQFDGSPKELTKLIDAGLLAEDGSVNGGLFKEVLGAAAGQRPQGVGRFFREGRLEGLPSSPADRAEVLQNLADRLFPDDSELDEPFVNRLVGTVTEDVPALRRALVDYGYLERNADGTGYRRVRTG